MRADPYCQDTIGSGASLTDCSCKRLDDSLSRVAPVLIFTAVRRERGKKWKDGGVSSSWRTKVTMRFFDDTIVRVQACTHASTHAR